MNKTKIFFDSEFTGLHQKTTLISIGLYISEKRYFYAEFTDYDDTQLDSWLIEHVINNLKFRNEIPFTENKKDSETHIINMKGSSENIKDGLLHWLSTDEEYEMWSDCLSYDWVLFNNIFGGAFDIPKNIYYIPFDICTMLKMKDVDPDISRAEFSEIDMKEEVQHNSLSDAKMIKIIYDKLTNI